jgi:anaerobic magnesium-protoporphyrin IX monomethyl ester cyclase
VFLMPSTNSRVVLCAPPAARPARKAESLGIRYLAAFAESQGFQVTIIDAHHWGWTIQKTIDEIVSLNPTLLGLSLIFHEQIPGSKEVLDSVRKYRPGVTCIAGGHVATFSPTDLLERIPTLSLVVRGEGEQVFLELLRKINQNGDGVFFDDLSPVAGITLGPPDFVSTPPPHLIKNLDSLPFPLRDSNAITPKTVTAHFSIIGSRGCYARCDFCSVPPFFEEASGAAWRLRSAENLFAEMVYLKNNYGATHISFLDDIFLARDQRSKNRARKLAQLLVETKSNIRFSIECRADAVDLDTFSELKRAGLARVFVGVEAGSPETLVHFTKDCTVDANVRALEILRQLKIPMTCGFILFHPDATLNEVVSNILFIKRFGIANRKAICSKLDAYPGTPAWARLSSQGRLYGDSIAPQYVFSDPKTSEICSSFRETFEPLRETDNELLRLEFEVTGVTAPDSEALEDERQTIRKSYSTAICDLAVEIVSNFESQQAINRRYSRNVNEIANDTATRLQQLRDSMERLLRMSKN